jgi:hypothetical protein
MAQRYGGKYSPGAQGAAPQTQHDSTVRADAAPPSDRRPILLVIVSLAFAVTGFLDDARGLVFGLAATGILLLSGWLTHEGLRAHAAYDARRVARRPAIPRKIFGAVLTGLGVAVGAYPAQNGLLYPALFGIAGAILHFGAFGADPFADKGLEGVDQFQVDRVAKAVDEAEAYLSGMKDAILRANDRSLEGRVDRFASAARALFRTVEGDPGDLTAARKYLSVYLMGARDATVKFADHYAQTHDASTRTAYEQLLTDLETTFADRTKAMLAGSHSDLDVEIEVLRDRLKLEA